MIAKNEIAVGWDGNFGIGASVGVFVGNVVFVEGFVVDKDLAVFDADSVSGCSDDAFDVAFGRVARVTEDYDVAALDGLPAIDEFVDEDALLVFEAWHHAGAFDLYWLIEKDDDEGGDRQRD